MVTDTRGFDSHGSGTNRMVLMVLLIRAGADHPPDGGSGADGPAGHPPDGADGAADGADGSNPAKQNRTSDQMIRMVLVSLIKLTKLISNKLWC